MKNKKKANKFSFLKKFNKFHIAVFLLLFFAIFLRFYNFDNRLPFGNDGSRDIAIAREALARHELPLIGSFSSAGPFVFGPLFYWTVMASYLIFPFSLTAPFIMTAVIGVLTVVVMMICGYLLGGNKLSLLVGLLAATSPQLVARSLMVGQHSFIAVFTSLLFLAFILYWQKKQIIYAFLMGLFLGTALSMHYQAINLLIFFLAILFVPGIFLRKKLLGVIVMFFGFFIPSLPLLVWDAQQSFANVGNILDYLLIGQYRLYVPNSWKLFIFNYLPSYWSFVVGGGLTWVGMIGLFFSAITVFIALYKKKLTGVLIAFLVIFCILLFVNKAYRGERAEGYLIYLAPFILIFTSFALWKSLFIQGNWKVRIPIKILGVVVLMVVLWANFTIERYYLTARSSQGVIEETADFLEKKYPNTKFAVYDYYNRSSTQSQALAITLEFRDKISSDGLPLAVICSSPGCLKKQVQIAPLETETIIDGRNIKDLKSNTKKWVKVNPENMYDDLIGWSKRHELKTTFSLKGYLEEKLHLK